MNRKQLQLLSASRAPECRRCVLALPRRRHVGRRGFSFIEILFAVMILGIGFIMIAGIFPVAISQTAASQDESIAATLGRSGVSMMSNIPGGRALFAADLARSTSTDPIWPRVYRFEGTTYDLIKGNLILPDDPRYAYIPLICRYRDANGQPASTAQAIIVAVQVGRRAAFNGADLVQTGVGGNPRNLRGTLSPVLVSVDLIENNSNRSDLPDQVVIRGNNAPAAAPGAALIMVGGTTSATGIPSAGNNTQRGRVGFDSSGRSVAGRVYRLGAKISGGTTLGSAQTFELAAGADLTVSAGPSGPMKQDVIRSDAFLVGQEFLSNNNTYRGGSMVVGVYSAVVPLH